MKYKAPEGQTGIDVGGQHFSVGEDGCIDVPDDGHFDNLLRPQGYVPYVEPAAEAHAEDGVAGHDQL